MALIPRRDAISTNAAISATLAFIMVKFATRSGRALPTRALSCCSARTLATTLSKEAPTRMASNVRRVAPSMETSMTPTPHSMTSFLMSCVSNVALVQNWTSTSGWAVAR